MSKNNPFVMPVMGATGSGKSQFVLRYLKGRKPARVLVWNPNQKKTPYPGTVVTTFRELYAATAAKKFQVVFVPSWAEEKSGRLVMKRQFDVFCETALELENLTLVAEEVKYVTRPGWSPPHWMRATADGRQFGLQVFGLSQRPAEIDRTLLANATFIRTGRLAYPDDIKVMAEYMQVDRAKITELRPLDWIEKDLTTGDEHAGTLTF